MAPEMLTQTLHGVLFALFTGTWVKDIELGDGPVARVGQRCGADLDSGFLEGRKGWKKPI